MKLINILFHIYFRSVGGVEWAFIASS